MNAPTKLAAFAAAMAVAFGAAAGAGAVLDPTDGDGETAVAAGHDQADAPASGAHGAGTDHDEGDARSAASGHGAGDAQGAAGGHGAQGASTLPGGLSSTQDGYALVPERTTLTAGAPSTLRFRIVGPDGRPVRDGYEVEAERELHLIVVRRDATGFQHLHPRRAADGTWSTSVTPNAAGSYRALADFTVGGVRRTLGVDLQVPGAFAPAPPAQSAVTSARTDGYAVELASGALRAGRDSDVRFRVTRDGRPVAGLQPYLGARGHLVALREGDLAYLHVHPEQRAATGEIPFMAEFPSAGRYHLFLQFRTGGRVHTAPLTVEVTR